MNEKRLERMEDMLSNLITMVGSINSKQQSMLEEQAAMRNEITDIKKEQAAMRNDIAAIQKEQAAMRNDIAAIQKEQAAMRNDIATIQKEQAAMRSEMETRHSEIMDKLKIIQADQDYIWEKTARNEREIAKIKNHVEL